MEESFASVETRGLRSSWRGINEAQPGGLFCRYFLLPEALGSCWLMFRDHLRTDAKNANHELEAEEDAQLEGQNHVRGRGSEVQDILCLLVILLCSRWNLFSACGNIEQLLIEEYRQCLMCRGCCNLIRRALFRRICMRGANVMGRASALWSSYFTALGVMLDWRLLGFVLLAHNISSFQQEPLPCCASILSITLHPCWWDRSRSTRSPELIRNDKLLY